MTPRVAATSCSTTRPLSRRNLVRCRQGFQLFLQLLRQWLLGDRLQLLTLSTGDGVPVFGLQLPESRVQLPGIPLRQEVGTVELPPDPVARGPRETLHLVDLRPQPEPVQGDLGNILVFAEE